MEKFCEKHYVEKRKRWLALLLSLCLIGTMFPISVKAENDNLGTGLCEHHAEHTTECGYVTSVNGQECGHVHDEDCGYQEFSECTHIHTEICGEDGENCTHEHDEDCGYVAGQECEHVHDENCGYVEAAEGSPCTFVCDICGKETESGLIDALPDAEDITEENFDEVAVMSLADFSLTGKPVGTTVKTINLNAAVLRPDSIWIRGGNVVYFGTYGGDAMSYRVLSSPNTQTPLSDSLLLDCNCVLERIVFSDKNDNQWTSSDCTVRKWLKENFYEGNVLSAIEKAAIVSTALSESTVYGVESYQYQDCPSTDFVFCLSAAEADGLYADNGERWKSGGYNRWWLRSAVYRQPGKAGFIMSDKTNSIDIYETNNYTTGASPAFNVELSKVLFASESSFVKSVSLASVSDSTATNWKLTLLDSNKTVSVTDGQNVTRRGRKITIPYTYNDSNTTNPVSQISVMITDKSYADSDAEVLYYGALEDTTITSGGASGAGVFTLPTDMTGKTCGADYYAYIIAENVNGGRTTDYASEPMQITIPMGTAVTEISSVEVTDIDSPVPGTALDTSATCTTTGVASTVPAVTWTPSDVTAAYNTSYTASVKLIADTDYEFSDAVTATVNGNNANVTKTDNENITITYTFNAIAEEVPVITNQPQSVAVKAGETATFTVAATGTNLTYQWQINRNDNKGFVNIGENSASYTTTATDKDCNGFQYQCVISSSAGTVTTQVATLTVTEDVTPPSVTKHIITATAGANGEISPSGAVEVTEGNSQTFTITAEEGYEIDTLQVDGAEVTAATNYTFENVTTSHTIEVTFKQAAPVPPVVEPPVIVTQPQSVSIAPGELATFTLVATGTDLTYEWQINRNNGSGFVLASTGKDAGYITGVTNESCDGYQYRCIVSNSAGSVTSDIVILTVTKYKIIEGADSSWTEETDENLVIRGDGEYSDFQNVKVDGTVIGTENYTVTEGSTIITLNAEYLKTLSAGSHTFEIVWTDGTAKTKFTVTNSSGGNNNNGGNTGGNGNGGTSGGNGNSGNNNNSGNTTNNTPAQTPGNTSNGASDTAVPVPDTANDGAAQTPESVSGNVTPLPAATDSTTAAHAEQQRITAPQTGDNFNLILWAVLLIASFVTLTGTIVRRRNNC